MLSMNTDFRPIDRWIDSRLAAGWQPADIIASLAGVFPGISPDIRAERVAAAMLASIPDPIDPDIANYSVRPFSVIATRADLRVVDAPDGTPVGVAIRHNGRVLALASGSVSPDPCESLREAVALLVSVARER